MKKQFIKVEIVNLYLHKPLYRKIAQKGGTCLMQGFPQRQIGEINRLVPKDAKASHEKISLSFQDGSILSHLASFRNILMLNKEFEDDGD